MASWMRHIATILVFGMLSLAGDRLLAQEYQQMVEEKKLAWEKKLEDCEKDERANILRHEDYMKKYEAAKRQYGNNIKYKNKIEGKVSDTPRQTNQKLNKYGVSFDIDYITQKYEKLFYANFDLDDSEAEKMLSEMCSDIRSKLPS